MNLHHLFEDELEVRIHLTKLVFSGGRCSGAVSGLFGTRRLILNVDNLDGLSQEQRSSRKNERSREDERKNTGFRIMEFVIIS
jgi:hypothetical protein